MSLDKALQAFVARVEEVMPSSRDRAIAAPSQHQTDSKLDLRDLYHLRSHVEDLESKTEFQRLVKETANSFSRKPGDTGFWSLNVEALLRRSGFYLSAYTGKTPDADWFFARYSEAFTAKTTLIRHLVPLEFVGFDENLVTFGRFRVVRLGRNDLESLLQSEINRVFYPHAYADVSTLTDIWFLEVTETVDAWEPGSGGPAGLRGPELEVKFTDFPSAVEYALKHLALYDWGTYQAPFRATKKSNLIEELDTGWDRFHVPFVISTHENFLWVSNALPSLLTLATEPAFDDEGEQIGERAVVEIFIEERQFKAEMERIAELLTGSESQRSGEWRFLDTALSYLAKAFFADGLDQLLWHIVAVESLLGERGVSGLTKRLARRVAFVVANDEQERTRITRLMTRDDGLYQFRSDLVHGEADVANKKVYLGQLREARELARKSVLWFLESFRNLEEERKQKVGTKTPTREEMIAAIDVLSNNRLDTDCVQDLIDLLASPKATKT